MNMNFAHNDATKRFHMDRKEDPAAEGERAGRREAELHKAINGMDPAEFGRLKDAYYDSVCGLASLVEELRKLPEFEPEAKAAAKLVSDSDEAFGILGGLL